MEDEASAQAYLAGPIFSQLKATPDLQNLTIKVSDIAENFSQITRAPL
ncbi:hypothetical protein H6F94_02980 [Leptolyngbya sp. FACHB-261]|nr:hypothetical protein [Leptolyngbya sp. FACHB-261]